MKTLRKPTLALFLSFLILFVSCTNETILEKSKSSLHLRTSQNDLTETQIRDIFKKYDKSFLNVKSNFENIIYKIDSGLSIDQIKDDEDLIYILDNLKEASIDLFYSLEFSNEDFYDIFETDNAEQLERQLIGASLLLYSFQPEFLNNNYNPPLAVSCFIETTGIAAGIAIIGALSGNLGGKALKKAFTDLVKKVGIRTLSGIGLALMAAEFAWCMLRD